MAVSSSPKELLAVGGRLFIELELEDEAIGRGGDGAAGVEDDEEAADGLTSCFLGWNKLGAAFGILWYLDYDRRKCRGDECILCRWFRHLTSDSLLFSPPRS